MYIIYERNESVLENFYPFTLSHPLWELRAGVFTIKELWERMLGEQVGVYIERDYMREYIEALGKYEMRKPKPGDVILCAHYFPTMELAEKVKELKEGKAILDKDGNIIAYGVSYDAKSYFEYYEKEVMDVERVSKLYDIIDLIKDRINFEFGLVDRESGPYLFDKNSVKMLNEDGIKIGRNVNIDPFVVIDATEGKVFIDNGVRIGAFSYLKGPLYIGENSIIKPHSKIYDGVSIGKVCKVAGEIEESIIMGYSNKQHDGFLGHAFVGEWVNLGALTTNSDLRNNYGEVKIQIREDVVRTNKTFLGLFVGDHTKSGILTMFNTGTVVGFSANVFGEGFQDKFIPSFSWGRDEVYHLDRAIETATRVLPRRGVEFKEAHKKLFEYIFELRLKEGL